MKLHKPYSLPTLLFSVLLLAACGAVPSSAAEANIVAADAATIDGRSAITTSNPLSETASGNTDLHTEVRGLRTFVIIPSESMASYIADEEFFADALAKYGINAGRQDTIGSTQEISGRLTLDLDDLGNALGENSFTVLLNTLKSDQTLRDGYLRTSGPRFSQYPEATFVATAIAGAPSSYDDGDEVHFHLTGNMTIRNITHPVTFSVASRLSGDILTGVAETTLLMSDFGIEPPNFLNTLTVADEIGIKIEFTAQAE